MKSFLNNFKSVANTALAVCLTLVLIGGIFQTTAFSQMPELEDLMEQSIENFRTQDKFQVKSENREETQEAVAEDTISNTGQLSLQLIMGGGSFSVKASSTESSHTILVRVTGTDGFNFTQSGRGQVITAIIPPGAMGVIDTVTAIDQVSGQRATQVFSF